MRSHRPMRLAQVTVLVAVVLVLLGIGVAVTVAAPFHTRLGLTIPPSSSASPTPSPSPQTTPTATPTPSATPSPTPTPTPSATPTPTPVPAAFIPLPSYGEPNCGLTMIKGQLRTADGLLNGVPVRVWWEGSDGFISLPSGEDPTKPAGYWDVVLDTYAKPGRWYVAVVDPTTGVLLSPVVTVDTEAEPCEPGSEGQQVITVDFVLQTGQIGRPGPTFTPSPTPVPTFTPTPYPTPDGQSRTVRVPILMYHYISTPPPGADRYRRDLSVPPDVFRAQMGYLKAQGYQTVSLRDLVYALTRGTPLPPRPIVITFDDGYRDNYENAFPVLKELGFTGTFFVLTGPIDQNNPIYMTWDQLREMRAAGMEIGVHSRDHVELRGRSYEYLVWQVLGASQAVERQLGFRPEVFSYPSGLYDQRTVEVVRSAHFWAAVTTRGGITHRTENLLTLRRVRVRGTWGVAEFAQALAYWEKAGR
ncbi:MAG: polysaccharide deacetylase family protein [Ardenticatenia bacterium]|nr:polysaccharide deacetylase family protein [Ardenticatenia bacterium]